MNQIEIILGVGMFIVIVLALVFIILFAKSKLGTLTPGKWADFILVDQDIFSIAPQDIWKTKVMQTWLAGEKVFDANRQN